MKHSMHCTKCGNNLDEDTSFCDKCGHEVASGINDKTTSSYYPKSKIILSSLILVLVVLVIGAGIIYLELNSSNKSTDISADNERNEQSTTSKIQQQISQLQSSQASTTQQINNLQEKNSSLRQKN